MLCSRHGFRIIIAAITTGLIAVAGCAVLPGTTMEDLTYDPAPNVLVVDADWQTLPVISPEQSCYQLPDLRVWGDGRVVRITRTDVKRQVDVGQLSPDRIGQFLALLKQQGALSTWQHFEAPNPNAVRFYLTVHLRAGTFANSANAPPAFYPKLLEFFNADVTPLVPERAFLIATAGYAPPETLQEWPARFNLSLAQAMDQGLWVSGDALSFLWQDANNTRSQHAFRQNDKTYAVALEIPGVGPKEPPEHCWAEWNSRLPRIEEITLEQARQIPGFDLFEPAYIPEGLHLQRVIDMIGTVISAPAPGAAPVTTHPDSISLEYGGPPGSGEFLAVGQRACVPGVLPPGMVAPPTPDLHPETVKVHDAAATVNRYSSPPLDWVTPAPGPHDYITLEWWEKAYCLTVGGSMSLEELTKVANSLQ